MDTPVVLCNNIWFGTKHGKTCPLLDFTCWFSYVNHRSLGLNISPITQKWTFLVGIFIIIATRKTFQAPLSTSFPEFWSHKLCWARLSRPDLAPSRISLRNGYTHLLLIRTHLPRMREEHPGTPDKIAAVDLDRPAFAQSLIFSIAAQLSKWLVDSWHLTLASKFLDYLLIWPSLNSIIFKQATTTTGGSKDSALPPSTLPRDQQHAVDKYGSISGNQVGNTNSEISYLKHLVSELSSKVGLSLFFLLWR